MTPYQKLLVWAWRLPPPWNAVSTWLFHSAVVGLHMALGWALWNVVELRGYEFGFVLGAYGYFWRETESYLRGDFSLDSVMDVVMPVVLGGIVVLAGRLVS